MLTAGKNFTISEGDSVREILRALSSWSDIVKSDETVDRRTFMDTFDWRLHRAGLRLQSEQIGKEGRRLRLERESEADLCPWPGRRLPRFSWDLPEGPLRDALDDVLDMRTLLPLVEVVTHSTTFSLLDSERKTVARVRVEEPSIAPSGNRAPRALEGRVCLLPIRGYRRSFTELHDRLAELPLEATDVSLQSQALAAVGTTEGGYTGKITTVLSPDEEAGTALTKIFSDLLATVRINEEGTRKNLDSEFLHDFRVAIRRTRSALSQLKMLIPSEELAHFRAEFRWLGGATGPTRDLDVYLLKFPIYRDSLPEHVGKSLLPLREFLVKHQRSEQRKLSRVLRSARYRKLIDNWQAFLDSGLEPATEAAASPISEIASSRLWKAARRVLRGGERAIRDQSPAHELHELRIEGKKLRYLMEFFRTLYPGKKIGALIKSLKVLQDNLGDFNDYEVQQSALIDFANQMVREGEVPATTLMAMGRLVARLEAGQEEERVRFQNCFESFSTDENRQLLKRLFRPKKKSE